MKIFLIIFAVFSVINTFILWALIRVNHYENDEADKYDSENETKDEVNKKR
jgi:CHASE3 domain sensor protein